MPNAVDTSLPPEPTGAAARLAARHAGDEALRLYGAWFCPFVQRVWITLCEKRIAHQYVDINPYHKQADFLALNPRGLVPTLAVPPAADGHARAPLLESSVICEFLDDAYADEARHGPALLPADPYQRARARLWMDHVGSRVVPAFYRLLQHTPGAPYSIEQARAELHGHIRALVEQMHPAGPWFLGPRISLVDISLAPWARRLWLIDHYKPGGLAIPADAAADAVWGRWKTWTDAVEARQSVRDTSSDDERYLLAYKRYAEDTTGSLVGQATRQGARLP